MSDEYKEYLKEIGTLKFDDLKPIPPEELVKMVLDLNGCAKRICT